MFNVKCLQTFSWNGQIWPVATKETIYMLQDLTGLEILISMKTSKTENKFGTGFKQPKPFLAKKPIINNISTTDQLFAKQYTIDWMVKFSQKSICAKKNNNESIKRMNQKRMKGSIRHSDISRHLVA